MKRNSRRKRRKDMKNSKYFAYPYCVWMVFFIAAPMLLVVYYAFINTSAGGDGGFTLTERFERGGWLCLVARV